MDLFLWRHAEAQDRDGDLEDLTRALTPRGEKQAARMAAWLDRVLPEGARVLCSPALRCEQTAIALQRKYRIRAELSPDAVVQQVLELAQWPAARRPVLLVGHQPWLGQLAAQLLNVNCVDGMALRKAAAWWLRAREIEDRLQVTLMAVQSPESV